MSHSDTVVAMFCHGNINIQTKSKYSDHSSIRMSRTVLQSVLNKKIFSSKKVAILDAIVTKFKAIAG